MLRPLRTGRHLCLPTQLLGLIVELRGLHLRLHPLDLHLEGLILQSQRLLLLLARHFLLAESIQLPAQCLKFSLWLLLLLSPGPLIFQPLVDRTRLADSRLSH